MTAARIEELEAQLETARRRAEEAEAKAIRIEEKLTRSGVENAVRDAIAKSATPVAPSALPDVIRRAIQSGDWREHPGHGLVKMDGLVPDMDMSTGSFVTPANWLKSLAVEAPHLFQQADAATGTTQVNPFMMSSWNMTEQGRLATANPELAKKLAAEAGRTLEA